MSVFPLSMVKYIEYEYGRYPANMLSMVCTTPSEGAICSQIKITTRALRKPRSATASKVISNLKRIHIAKMMPVGARIKRFTAKNRRNWRYFGWVRFHVSDNKAYNRCDRVSCLVVTLPFSVKCGIKAKGWLTAHRGRPIKGLGPFLCFRWVTHHEWFNS